MSHTLHGRSRLTLAGATTWERLPHLVRLSLAVILILMPSLLRDLALEAIPPSADETRLYVGHGAQFTARIPSTWVPDRSLTYDYRFRSGFIASVPFGRTAPFDSLGQVCTAVAMDERYAEDGQMHTATWRGQAACIVRTSADTPYDPVSLVIAHPAPAQDGHNTFIAVTIDGEHFDDIAATISFDPSIITPIAYLDAALDLIETRSLWREHVDWPEVRATAHAYIIDQATSDSLWLTGVYDAISYVLDEIRQAGGDAHHAFLPPLADTSIGTPGPSSRPYIAPTGMALNGGIGYISLPGVSTGSDPDRLDMYVSETRAHLRNMQTDATCGWIVDLRGNTGGNMYAMLGGLAPLFPPSTLLEFRNVVGTDTAVAITGDGVLLYDDTPVGLAPSPLSRVNGLDLAEQPVAVLIGPSTASAGEGVTVALVHREGTRFFGQGTAGIATAPTGFHLFDGAVVELATVWISGPYGAIYPDGIEPDIVMMSSNLVEPLGDDPVVQRAADWLVSQPGCH